MLRNKYIVGFFVAIVSLTILIVSCRDKSSKIVPIRTIAELNIGETQEVELSNGELVTLQLLGIREVRDSLRNALRCSEIKLSVDGNEVVLKAESYNLPVTVNMVQIDCPAIKTLYSGEGFDRWGLSKDARFRLWPKGSPFITPGTFRYPIKQKWLANLTQSSNEPTYVNEGEKQQSSIYYHSDFDIGGSEGMDEVISAVDGLIVSANNRTLGEYINDFGGVRNDVVYIVDNRAWYYRYSHLDIVDETIKAGERIEAGQHIGYVGKQGASGGWVHLHFGIKHKDSPSGNWGAEDVYAYAYEAYINEYKPSLLAHARPHQLTWVGERVILDGRKSESFKGNIVSYEWQFCDGESRKGAVQTKVYNEPGEYSEILKVTDSKGNVDYDFCVVQVYDKKDSESIIPTIQAAYHPTLNIEADDSISFLVRSFNCEGGTELWDFGDGSPLVTVNSGEGKVNQTSKGEFAKTTHSYTQPGNYIATVTRTNENGVTAIGRLHVHIDE